MLIQLTTTSMTLVTIIKPYSDNDNEHSNRLLCAAILARPGAGAGAGALEFDVAACERIRVIRQ